MQLFDVAGYHLRGLVHGFAALGIDVDAVLREAQIARAALDEPETRFVEPQMMQLWLAAERRWGGGEPFGLVIGTRIPFGALELIDYLVAACADVREGVETLVRYADLCASGFHYSLEPACTEDGSAMRLRLHHRYGIEAVSSGIIEYIWATMLWRLREYGDSRFRPALYLRHTPAAHHELYRQVLGRVYFGKQHDELYIPIDQWTLANPRRDPMLSRFLAKHADDVLSRVAPPSDFLGALRTAIADGLRLGDVGIERVARRLALSARTLQRRLVEESCVYKELVDEVRFELGCRYLTHSKLSQGEISDLLAYSEPRAFQRAFRRRSGVTPGAYRDINRARPESSEL
jgi:AraC-like DNA-binding protein